MKKRWLTNITASAVLFLTLAGCSKIPQKNTPPETTAPEVISWQYKPVNNEQQIRKLEEGLIGEVIKEKQLEIGKIILYLTRSDKEYLHAAFLSDTEAYDLGVVSEVKNFNPAIFNRKEDDLNAVVTKPLERLGGTLIRLDGIYGANAPQSNYYLVVEGIPKPFLRVDGHITEVDLDLDGWEEIIASSGTPPQTTIYKWDNGVFLSADVNKMLGADAVLFVNRGRLVFFAAYYKGQPDRRNYRYTAEGLQLVVTGHFID